MATLSTKSMKAREIMSEHLAKKEQREKDLQQISMFYADLGMLQVELQKLCDDYATNYAKYKPGDIIILIDRYSNGKSFNFKVREVVYRAGYNSIAYFAFAINKDGSRAKNRHGVKVYENNDHRFTIDHENSPVKEG